MSDAQERNVKEATTGGHVDHPSGRAHEFTTQEARAAGRKGHEVKATLGHFKRHGYFSPTATQGWTNQDNPSGS